MRRLWILLSALALCPYDAIAQQSVLPYVVTGQTSSGALITSPVSPSTPLQVSGYSNAGGAEINDPSGVEASYAAAASFTPAAGVLAAVCGSATKIVALRGLIISGTASTAGTLVINLIKTSTAPSAGTAITPVPEDSNDAASTASAAYYTSAPTAGTPIGTMDSFSVGFPTPTAVGLQIPATIAPPPSRKPIILRGTGQCLEVQTSSSALTGGSMQTTVTWTESATYP